MSFRVKVARLGALVVVLMAASWCVVPSALADPVPSPGSPGPQYSPALTRSTFSDPGAALRPKYRWWQPIADDNDTTLRSEVDEMAAAGAGGYEQNGFGLNMNPAGITPQFQSLANSQEFNDVFGWGTPAWSDRTAASESEAARDGLIGDMNEGSRWNNNVPAVYSQNQPAAAQQVVFGDSQLQPGQTPSSELPPALANRQYGEASGVSTELCQLAKPGDRNLKVDSIAGLLAGDMITLGQGPGAESATIQKVGTASPCVPLSQPVKAGAIVVHVPLGPSDLGSTSATTTTSALSAISGTLGTALLPAQYQKGETVTIGSGPSAQIDMIASIGTYDVAAPTAVAAAAPAGATSVLLASTTNFLKADTITLDAGQPDQQTRTITAVGEGGTGTTLSQPAAQGDLGLTVASTSDLAAGNQIVIDPGRPDQQTATIASVDGKAATDNVLLQDTTVDGAFPAGTTVQLAHLGVAFSPALTAPVTVGASVTDTGTGITLTTPLKADHPTGDTLVAQGTGVTLTRPLTQAHDAGADTVPQTTLYTQANPGDTTLTLVSAAGMAVGDTITFGGSDPESGAISKIGGTTSHYQTITLAQPLTKAHFGGEAVLDIAPRSPATQLNAPAPAGATNLKVDSTSGMTAGDRIVVGSASGVDEIVTIAKGGVGTPGADGTGITLSEPLVYAHAAGERVADSTLAGDTAGVSDLAVQHLIALVFAQCTSDNATTCPATTIDGTRDLDPDSVQVATDKVIDGKLQYGGPLPQGNGNPWEEVAIYETADGEILNGATPTSPDYWLDHLSTTGAQAMAEYFDDHILNNPATEAAIRYEDTHTGTPAVFEDSLEESINLKWTFGMIDAWKQYLGYDPTRLLVAFVGNNNGMSNTPLFDFPQSDGHGQTLGSRVRQDYLQLRDDLYVHRYVPTLDQWADSHGLVTRFQSYGDPIDTGEAAANEGIAEGEHLAWTNEDETQKFKVVASGSYQNGNKVVSDECCEEISDVWADTFGVDGSGTGPEGSSILSNANSAYADIAGGATQIVWHGWPYQTFPAGAAAVWPGNTYGGDNTFSAAYGPNEPQYNADRAENLNLARIALALRQGEPAFDAAVYDGSIASSSSLAQDGYTYGYISPAFLNYSDARYGYDPGGGAQNADGTPEKVLFPGHGDYRSAIIDDQAGIPVAAAQKILSLARQGLPVVIVGAVPDSTLSAAPGTVSGMAAQDALVQQAMAKLVAMPNVRVVADATATDSQADDGNVPAALHALGIEPTTALSPVSVASGAAAQPVLALRRHDARTDTDYYYLFNPDLTATVSPQVTLTGSGAPYRLDTWTGTASAIDGYTAPGRDRIGLSVRIAPGNFALIAISPHAPDGATPAPAIHATATTADADPAWSADVVFDGGGLEARAAQSGTYTTTLSNGQAVKTGIDVPQLAGATGPLTLTDWQLSVDSWGPPPSGAPTQTSHTPIPASGTMTVGPLSGTTNGALPSWTQITPQNGFPVADNLTNVGGIGTYTTSFDLLSTWRTGSDGAYLNLGVAVDTVQITVNGRDVTGIDQNDRNEIDLGPYLRPGLNAMKVQVAIPLRNAVAVAPATPATGQVPNSAEPIGALQGGSHEANMGLIGPVVLTPYGQATVRGRRRPSHSGDRASSQPRRADQRTAGRQP